MKTDHSLKLAMANIGDWLIKKNNRKGELVWNILMIR